jgi:Gas vesicle protein G
MLLVDDILFFPIHSIMWVFKEIGEIAEKELAGEATSITEQLRILYMQLETGRITEVEFEAGEKVLLDRLELIESRMDDQGNTEESDDDEAEESDLQGVCLTRR